MKKISTTAVKQANNFREQRLAIGLWGIDRVRTVCWMNPVPYYWNRGLVQLRKL
jgi:hypothetical protein